MPFHITAEHVDVLPVASGDLAVLYEREGIVQLVEMGRVAVAQLEARAVIYIRGGAPAAGGSLGLGGLEGAGGSLYARSQPHQ